MEIRLVIGRCRDGQGRLLYVPRLERGGRLLMVGGGLRRQRDARRAGERLVRQLWRQRAVTVIGATPPVRVISRGQ